MTINELLTYVENAKAKLGGNAEVKFEQLWDEQILHLSDIKAMTDKSMFDECESSTLKFIVYM